MTLEVEESVFARIRMRSRSTCSFCLAVWEMLERDEPEDRVLAAWAGHLGAKHGWVVDEVTDG